MLLAARAASHSQSVPPSPCVELRLNLSNEHVSRVGVIAISDNDNTNDTYIYIYIVMMIIIIMIIIMIIIIVLKGVWRQGDRLFCKELLRFNTALSSDALTCALLK